MFKKKLKGRKQVVQFGECRLTITRNRRQQTELLFVGPRGMKMVARSIDAPPRPRENRQS